jgi:hypothetical protein
MGGMEYGITWVHLNESFETNISMISVTQQKSTILETLTFGSAIINSVSNNNSCKNCSQ